MKIEEYKHNYMDFLQEILELHKWRYIGSRRMRAMFVAGSYEMAGTLMKSIKELLEVEYRVYNLVVAYRHAL